MRARGIACENMTKSVIISEYRWRGGRLEQLSRDHSLSDTGGSGHLEESHVVTRAVGIEPALSLDVYRDSVSADDRFLLCSDGLTRVVQESQIATLMQSEDIAASVEELIKLARAQ